MIMIMITITLAPAARAGSQRRRVFARCHQPNSPSSVWWLSWWILTKRLFHSCATGKGLVVVWGDKDDIEVLNDDDHHQDRVIVHPDRRRPRDGVARYPSLLSISSHSSQDNVCAHKLTNNVAAFVQMRRSSSGVCGGCWYFYHSVK